MSTLHRLVNYPDGPPSIIQYEAEALKIAGREAYEDTWGSKAVYSGVELVEIWDELEEETTEDREKREYEQDCQKGVLF